MRLIRVKSIFYPAIQKWWLIYGLSLALFFLWIVITIWGPPTPKPADEVVFYPWIPMQAKGLVLTFVPLGGFAVGCLLYGVKKKSLGIPFGLATLTLSSWIIIIAWLGPLILPLDNRPWPTGLFHIHAIRSGGHVYNLATHRVYSSAFDWTVKAYILYECDSLGISCKAIYRYEPKSREDVLGDDANNPPFLSFTEMSISVHIAGRVVYIHPTANP